jgi:hypothetical protein
MSESSKAERLEPEERFFVPYELTCPKCQHRVAIRKHASWGLIGLGLLHLLFCLIFRPIRTIRALRKNTCAHGGKCPSCDANIAVCPACASYWIMKWSFDVPCESCGLRLK